MDQLGKTISIWWNCKLCKFHDWTCAKEQGIMPTQEQLKSGMDGFWDYAKMYCNRCGVQSKLNPK